MAKKKAKKAPKKRSIGDNRTTVGKNINNKLAKFAEKHPGSSEAKFLKLLRGEMAKRDVNEKIRSIEIEYDQRPYSTSKLETECLNCSRPVKHTKKVDVHVNGKALDYGDVGNSIAQDCFEVVTSLAATLQEKEFRPRIFRGRFLSRIRWCRRS